MTGVSPGSWPAVTLETRPWSTNPNQVGPDGSRPNHAERMLSSIEVETPAFLADVDVQLRSSTVALAQEASAAIGRLELRSEHLAGLGDLMVRTEAVASSRIEHVHADLDDIARASIGATAADSAARTVAAAQALRSLTDSTNDGAPLTESAILSAHRLLLAGDKVEGAWAGRYRAQQNWIGGSDVAPLNAAHIPPAPDMVEPLMADLLRFADRDDVGGLAQAAIVHAQFEAIHPFTDGNGRIGRGLIAAVLRRNRLTNTVTVPAAAAMLADVDAYFHRLKEYREGNVDAMVAYLAAASIDASEAAERSADALAVMPDLWLEKVRPRRGSSAYRMIAGLVRMPILDAARARELTGSTPVRTYEAIDRLVEAGILHEISHGARNRIWAAVDVMTELKEIEQRIGVRARPSKRWR